MHEWKWSEVVSQKNGFMCDVSPFRGNYNSVSCVFFQAMSFGLWLSIFPSSLLPFFFPSSLLRYFPFFSSPLLLLFLVAFDFRFRILYISGLNSIFEVNFQLFDFWFRFFVFWFFWFFDFLIFWFFDFLIFWFFYFIFDFWFFDFLIFWFFDFCFLILFLIFSSLN